MALPEHVTILGGVPTLIFTIAAGALVALVILAAIIAIFTTDSQRREACLKIVCAITHWKGTLPRP